MREFEVLVCLTDCWCNKDIAIKYGIAYETVRVHRKNIYRKLNVNDINGLMSWYKKYIENGN